MCKEVQGRGADVLSCEGLLLRDNFLLHSHVAEEQNGVSPSSLLYKGMKPVFEGRTYKVLTLYVIKLGTVSTQVIGWSPRSDAAVIVESFVIYYCRTFLLLFITKAR